MTAEIIKEMKLLEAGVKGYLGNEREEEKESADDSKVKLLGRDNRLMWLMEGLLK